MRHDLAWWANCLGPVVNRVVFVGLDAHAAASPVLTGRCVATNVPSPARVVVSGTVSRVAPEFAAAGLALARRGTAFDIWRGVGGAPLRVTASSIEPEGERSVVTEYATLLTTAISLPGGQSIRVATTAAQLACLGLEFRDAGDRIGDSVAAEEFLRITVDDGTVLDALRRAPAELRVSVTASAARLAESSGLSFVAGRLIRGRRADGTAAAVVARALGAVAAAAA